MTDDKTGNDTENNATGNNAAGDPDAPQQPVLPATPPVPPSPPADDDLDFSSEDTDATASVPSLQAGSPYDPRPAEDGARRTIAYLLISLLWFIVWAVFVLIACGTMALADIKEVSVVLGPVVTLVSAATGFYYGTKSTTPPR